MTASPYTARTGRDHSVSTATGVALVNLGSPAEPSAEALRPYLASFLSDPRVVEPPPPRPLWLAILHGVILRVRPARSAELYRRVWTAEGSPLTVMGRRQAAGLETRLRLRRGADIHVRFGVTYGEPSLASALRELRDLGCGRILILPAFPQYSGPSTGAVFDAVARELMTWRAVPDLHFIRSYHDRPAYIAALAGSVRERWAAEGESQRLLMSYHGVPERYCDAGDPYRDQCLETSRLLADALGIGPDRWTVTFQSRFGREAWLQPYTRETLEQWGREKVELADAICPGFSADCLETLDELARENREVFEQAGGVRFRYIACLNDRPEHLAALAEIASEAMNGWGR